MTIQSERVHRIRLAANHIRGGYVELSTGYKRPFLDGEFVFLIIDHRDGKALANHFRAIADQIDPREESSK